MAYNNEERNKQYGNGRRNNYSSRSNGRYQQKDFREKSYKNSMYGKSYEKPTLVTKSVMLGTSDIYDENIGQLIDILTLIPFDKISIQVSVPKTTGTGFMQTGSIKGFDPSTYEFKITFGEKFANTINFDEMVIIPRIKKDKSENITYIICLNMVKGEKYPVISEEDFTSSESDNEVTE